MTGPHHRDRTHRSGGAAASRRGTKSVPLQIGEATTPRTGDDVHGTEKRPAVTRSMPTNRPSNGGHDASPSHPSTRRVRPLTTPRGHGEISCRVNMPTTCRASRGGTGRSRTIRLAARHLTRDGGRSGDRRRGICRDPKGRASEPALIWPGAARHALLWLRIAPFWDARVRTGLPEWSPDRIASHPDGSRSRTCHPAMDRSPWACPPSDHGVKTPERQGGYALALGRSFVV